MKEVKISVLMSIYNEREQDIRESIDSILGQSESHFEFIIIVDNPDRKEIARLIRSYNDDRIRLFYNEKNIGLAMSMNYAASLASAEVFARMDADDIAVLTRFEKELKIINTGYDIVFSNYTCIDDNNNPVPFNQVVYTPEGLDRVVALNPGIVHHPTTMFTRELFRKVGGYRNFPCAQDNDMWLRMQEVGARFYMITEPLLKYRVSERSISGSKWFKQQLTTHYIIELSIQRLRKGVDNFSVDNYNQYLQLHHLNDKEREGRLRKSEEILVSAMDDRVKNRYLLSLLKKTWVFITSPILRRYYILLTRKRIIMS